MEKRQKARFRRIGATNQYERLPHLPQEIIEEIMACLPVESLLRFKCVSKLWCLLISSNSFIKTHLAKSSKNKSLERHRVILGNSIVKANQCFSPSFLQDPLATAVEFDYPMCGLSRDSANVVGSCNGLVCFLKNDKDFILWNPSLRKFKKLPSFDDDTRGKFVYAYGFGFDESNDDYKVFCNWIELTDGEEDFESTDQTIIYSLKMDSWRKVENPMIDPDFELQCNGIVVSGKLHWRVYDWDRKVHSTVSFDLEKETFGTVEWPGDNENGFVADAIDGCLCCVCPSKSYDEAGYWILKEYGVKDSWHRLATLGRFRYDFGGDDPSDYYFPMIAGVDGEILFWDEDSKFILFKGDGDVLSSSGVVGSDALDLPRCPPVIYVESLVEP